MATATLSKEMLETHPWPAQLRVVGSVSVFDHHIRPDYLNCTSGGPIPFSATQCRQPFTRRPPYIKKSLPYCRRAT